MAMTLSEARRTVERERHRCVDECEAFRSFRAAVARWDGPPDATPGITGGLGEDRSVPAGRSLGVRVGSRTGATGGCRPIRDAYRRFVFAVDHVGDESLAEHVAAELGEDIAGIVTDGRPTPAVRRVLLDRIDVAIHARESFVDVLDREADSLAAVEATCGRLRSWLDRIRAWESASDEEVDVFDSAFGAWDRLDEVVTSLDEAAAARQATLARHRRSLATIDDDVADYLYDGRPALGEIASVGRFVAEGRRAVADALGRTA
jgi:hypothetical protein